MRMADRVGEMLLSVLRVALNSRLALKLMALNLKKNLKHSESP